MDDVLSRQKPNYQRRREIETRSASLGAKLRKKFPSNVMLCTFIKRKKGHKCILKRCRWRWWSCCEELNHISGGGLISNMLHMLNIHIKMEEQLLTSATRKQNHQVNVGKMDHHRTMRTDYWFHINNVMKCFSLGSVVGRRAQKRCCCSLAAFVEAELI